MQFWGASLRVNMGTPGLLLISAPLTFSGDGGLGKEAALLLGPVKTGSADAH